MKRTAILGALILCATYTMSAQMVDDGSRDRSKYANDTFRDDDRYKSVQPYETVSVAQPKGRKVKNIIFMIGDGMGFEQISAAWVLNGGHLNMDNMTYTGVSRTYAADKLITDSCAGGTALANGEKTNYGYIAVDTEGAPMTSVLKTAQEKGKKTGVAVVCRLNDATPSAYCCNSIERSVEADIAAQYVDSGVDFIAGGGYKFFAKREDGRNLVEEMKAKGYSYVDNGSDLNAATRAPLLGLFADLEMEPALDRGEILGDCAMKAIELLDNRKGFFLMIEGSCIDDWCHKQKVGYMAEELFDFDKTLGRVLEWAEKDGETLVVVTADHATGGMTLVGGGLQDHSVKVHFSTKGHNGILVPIFAYGPHAEDFVGVHENAEVGQIVRKLIK